MKTLNDILLSLKELEDIELFVIDLFCGAGGMSEGVEEARIENRKCAKVVCCVNHDKNAIESHDANIPDALHFIEDIRILNLTPVITIVDYIRKLYPEAKIMLHASLECTNFSKAKGGQSRDADSRTLAEHLFRYIEDINPDYIQIENVEEFMTWGPLIVKVSTNKDGIEYCPCNIIKKNVKVPRGQKKSIKWQLSPQMIPDPDKKGTYYNRWIENVKKYGYNFDKRILNSADFGARTSRRRFFGIFAKYGLPIIFPEPTHSKTGLSDLFSHKGKWMPVKDVLDLSDEGNSIFGRKKQLAENTFRRHYSGLIKFVAGGKDAYLIKWNSMNKNGIYLAPGIDEPCPVVSTQNRLGVANISFLSKYFSGHPDSKNIPITGPAHTIKCIDNHALVTANFLSCSKPNNMLNQLVHKYICSYSFNDSWKSIDAPSPTLLTKDRLSVMSPLFFSSKFLDMQYGNSRCASIEKPAGSILANPKHCLVTCNHWLMNTNFKNVGSKLTDPAPTITANRKWHYLVNPQYVSTSKSTNSQFQTYINHLPEPQSTDDYQEKDIPSFVKFTSQGIIYEIYDTDIPIIKDIKEFMAIYAIIDIKQRMLNIPELKQIMGFPKDYILIGSQADQKKFIGNAVEVNQAKANIESLCFVLRKKRLMNSHAA